MFKCCSFSCTSLVLKLKVSRILPSYWPMYDIVKLFNGEHRAKVIVHCVGHVIVSCFNNSIQSFEWSCVVPFYYSLVDIRVKAFGIVFTNYCNGYFFITFFLFYNSFNLSPIAAMYSATVSSYLILPFVSYALCLLPIACLIIVDGDSSFRDVSSAFIIDSALENLKSQLGIIPNNLLFKGLVIMFSLHCIEICSSKVIVIFF